MKGKLLGILLVALLIFTAACQPANTTVVTTAPRTTAAQGTTAALSTTAAQGTTAAPTTGGATTTAAQGTTAAPTTGGATTTAAPAKLTKLDKMVTISMSVLDRGAISGEYGTYEMNDAVKYINEEMNKYNVTVKVVPVVRTESRAKMNAMIAAKTAPDILWEFSRPWMDDLRIQKVILPVGDIVEKYSTAYKAYFAKNRDLLEPYVKLEDGQIWGFTSLRAATALPVAGAWTRYDMIKAVGGKLPTTLEELHDVATKIKAAMPDVTPMVGTWHYINLIKGTFGISSDEIKEGDKLIPIPQSKNYKEAMEWARKFYQDGLIDREYLTDTNFVRQKQLWTSGKAAFMFDGVGIPGGYKDMIKADPKVELAPLAPFKSSYGQFMYTPQAAARFYVKLNATMKDDVEKQKAAMLYLDWTIDVGWKIITYGREGVQYKLNAQGLRERIPDSKGWPYGEFALLTQEVFTFGQSAFGEPEAQFKPLLNLNDYSYKQMLTYPNPQVTPYQFSNEAYTTFTTPYSAKMSELESKMIADANYSVDMGIAELKAFFDANGGAPVWEAKNKWYQDNKATMEQFQKGYNAYKDGLLKNDILPKDIGVK